MGGVLYGLLVGAQHALEPDHLAAVMVLSSDRPVDVRRGAWIGAWWGAGHTLALLAVVAVVIAVDAQVPEPVALVLELCVAVMLIVLGALAMRRSVREGREGPAAEHRHGDVVHVHAVGGAHLHVGRRALATRPLMVGMVHGLAGSGALTAMIATALPSDVERIGYVLAFGVGSSVGMMLLSGIAGWPLQRIARSGKARRTMGLLAGAGSILLGAVWGAPLVAALL